MPAALANWLGAHPQIYLPVASVVIVGASLLALRPWFRRGDEASTAIDWRWGVVLFLVLVAGRWPSVCIPREVNADESGLYAGAHVLTHDPVFLRSIDVDTSGPINVFVLVPAGLAGWNSYFGVRLTALVLLALALTLLHLCLGRIYPAPTVRLATLAVAVLEALTNSFDLLHYSSELASLVWLTGAACAAAQRWARGGGPYCNLAGGLLLGAVPLSKLQVVPIALGFGLVWLVAELRRSDPEAARRRLYLVAGAILPSVLILLPVVIAGKAPTFWISYFQSNLNYVATGLPLSELFRIARAKSTSDDSLLHQWIPAALLACAVGFALARPKTRAARIALWLAVGTTIVALGCVLRAGRPFLHYWQLVVFPLAAWLGVHLGSLAQSTRQTVRRAFALAVFAGLVGFPLWHRYQTPSYGMVGLSYFVQQPRAAISACVLRHANGLETVAVWGRASYIYVETGLRQSAVEAHTARVMLPGPLQPFFRDRFLADLLVNRPDLFVDATGPCSFDFVAEQFRHERNFPQLGAVIREYYTLVDTVDEARVYLRRDLVAAASTNPR